MVGLIDLDIGSTIAILASIMSIVITGAGLISLYIRQQVALKVIQNRQDNLEARIIMMETLLSKQSTIDKQTKDSLHQLELSILALSTQMIALMDRLQSDVFKRK